MDVLSHAAVVEQIDAFLDRHKMAPSRFGRDALGEPQFVGQLRAGRVPVLSTLGKLRDFMRARDQELNGSDMLPSSSDPGTAAHRLIAGGR